MAGCLDDVGVRNGFAWALLCVRVASFETVRLERGDDRGPSKACRNETFNLAAQF